MELVIAIAFIACLYALGRCVHALAVALLSIDFEERNR